MPIQFVERNGGKNVEIHVSGKVAAQDFALFVPIVDRLVQEHDSINMLMLIHDFHGWTMGAFWEDTKFAVNHFADIRRLAVVGESKWEKNIATLCQPFTLAEVRYFDITKLAAARRWVEHRTKAKATV